MSEAQPGKERLCAGCPNRNRVSRAIAKLAGRAELADGCEGNVIVSRGEIITQIRQGDEAAPDPPTWNSMIETGDGVRRYSRTEWPTQEELCGRDPIESAEGEVPYVGGDGTWVTDGHKYAAFISGSKEAIGDLRAMLAMTVMLNGPPE